MNKITLTQILHYSKRIRVKSSIKLKGRGVKNIRKGVYDLTTKAANKITNEYGIYNLNGIKLSF